MFLPTKLQNSIIEGCKERDPVVALTSALVVGSNKHKDQSVNNHDKSYNMLLAKAV